LTEGSVGLAQGKGCRKSRSRSLRQTRLTLVREEHCESEAVSQWHRAIATEGGSTIVSGIVEEEESHRMQEEPRVRRWTSPIGLFVLVTPTVIGCVLVWYLFLRPPFTREMVKPGMTVEQVEAIFGKPGWVHPEYILESRGYTNDQKHYVYVTFKNGRVFEIEEFTRDTRLIKPG
jgi:hypothetical protein